MKSANPSATRNYFLHYQVTYNFLYSYHIHTFSFQSNQGELTMMDYAHNIIEDYMQHILDDALYYFIISSPVNLANENKNYSQKMTFTRNFPTSQ